MLGRLVIAVVYGIITALVCLLVGTLISSIGSGPFDTVGHFLSNYAWIIGALVALLAFFGGWALPSVGGPKAP
jgi:hypothetical protein